MPVSLREKKKTQTRSSIYEAAVMLFSEKGFTSTTLCDIAEAANISQRTIFSYFPSKEAIILDSNQAFINSFIEHIERRGEMSVFDAIRTYRLDRADACATQQMHINKIKYIVNSSPELQEHLASMLSKLEERLAVLIAREKGLSALSIHVSLIAGSIRAMIAYAIRNESNLREFHTEATLNFTEAGLRAASKE